MDTIHDAYFGKMTYRHSWKTTTVISFFGKKQKVEVIAYDPDKEGITHDQQTSYSKNKDSISKYAEKYIDLISLYLAEKLQTQPPSRDDIISSSKPTAIVFQRDGSWGILFDSSYDSEHGIALYWESCQISVGAQDDFL